MKKLILASFFLFFLFLPMVGRGEQLPVPPSPTPAPTRTPPPAPSPTAAPLAMRNIFIPYFGVPEDHVHIGYSGAWYSGFRHLWNMNFVSGFYRHFPMAQENNPFPGKELLPMVKCDQLLYWEQNYPNGWDQEVLVLNEPTLWGEGCNLSPEEAAEFVENFDGICPDCIIIAGNMSQVDRAIPWFEEFMALNPPIDGIGIHHYGFIPGISFEEQLNFYSQFDLPVWVTEFGTDNPTEAAHYRQICSQNDLCSRMYYFAPYLPPCNVQESFGYSCWNPASSLYNADGELTAVGLSLFEGSWLLP